MNIQALWKITRDPFKQYAGLLLLATLGLLALDVWWLATSRVLAIPAWYRGGDGWVLRVDDPGRFWFAASWYFALTAFLALCTAIVFRLLRRFGGASRTDAPDRVARDPESEDEPGS